MPASKFVSGLTAFRAGLLIFAISFAVRVACIVLFHPYHNLARFELERVALSLASTGVFGNPYAIPTGPSAHVSPGYPLILAALFRLFGTGIPAEIVKELVATAVTSLQYALLPAVALSLRIDFRAGLLAGIVSALYPVKLATQIDGDWDTPYTALFLILICMLTAALWREKRLSLKNAVLQGLFWGLALLFVSALLPLFGVMLCLGFYFCRRAGLKRYLGFAGVEMATAALCLSPWVIRNYEALGSPIVTRSNFGLEMRISNNDWASPSERVNDERGLYKKYHPLQSVTEAMRVRQEGEVAYNQQALNEAKTWIREHPSAFIKLCLERVRWFWFFTDPTSKMKTAFLDITVILGFVGLIQVTRTEPMSGVMLAAILVVYPLPNYLIHLGLRQKYPIDWMMTLLSAAALVRWAGGFRTSVRR